MSSTAQLPNSSDNSTTDGIIRLIELVSKAKESIPLSSETDTNTTTATATATAAAAGPIPATTTTGTTIDIVTTDSSITLNNIDNSNSASLPAPDNSNRSAPAPASVSFSVSGSASTFGSFSASISGSGSGSTSTNATNSGSNNTSATSNNGDVSNEISDASCWMLRVFDQKSSGANNKRDNNTTIDEVNDGSVNFDHESKQKLHNQLDKLEKDLKYVQSAFVNFKALEKHFGGQFKKLQGKGESLQSVITKMGQLSKGTSGNHPILTKQLQFYIKAITEMVMELKYHVPSPYAMMLPDESQENDVEVSASDSLKLIDEMIKIRDNNVFRECLAFEDFEANYKSLDLREKLCLLCFAVFPENALVKKRLLTYWWIGEGFIPDPKVDADKMAEEVADEILKRFLEKGFIKPEIKKRRLVGFRMHSLIRYAVIFAAARVGFFDFDSVGNPTAKFPSCQRVCLNKIGEKYSRKDLPSLEPEKLHALFNVNDPYPDFNADWFSRMRNVNVLCLGRWENSSKKRTKAEETNRHVEVDSTEFLKGLGNMKHLKFLSLQGISRIDELPDAIKGLVNLRILDLNACHNLEALQENIVCLQNLTHLDVSECFMLDCMPKGLGSLTELQVLKGFVISNLKIKNAGTLDDLKGLTKLRKLSIYTTKKDFPGVQDRDALRHFTKLQKLTIAWGWKSRETNQNSRTLTRSPAVRQSSVTMSPDLPENLLKLDLQCCPETKAPIWLSPIKLKRLEKLYIRGGHLSDLGQAQGGNDKWEGVKILRLKFLQELEMDWRVLHKAFPNLIYLEKFNCPKLTFFPCDGSGVWIDRNKLSEQALKELEFTWSFLSARAT